MPDDAFTGSQLGDGRRERATPAERGRAFERQLHALFLAHGYRVEHDVRRTGRSGAAHQLDVWAELDLPLQAVRVVVEAKAHAEPVDKDALLKLQQVVDDLGADRGVLASLGGFAPGALKMAAGGRVDLWDRERVARLLGEAALATPRAAGTAAATAGDTFALPARLSPDEARARAEAALARRRRGSLFGVGRVEEALAGVTLVQRPLYQLALEVEVEGEERRGLLGRAVVRTVQPGWLLVDAVTGSALGVGRDGRLRQSGAALPELAPDEADALAALPGGGFTRDDLVALGYRSARAAQLVAALAARGLLEQDGTDGAGGRGGTDGGARPGRGRGAGSVRWRVASRLEVSLGGDAPGDLLGAAPLEGAAAAAPLEPVRLSRAGAVRATEALVPGAHVRGLDVLLHPLYAVALERPGGARREERIDGVTGAALQPGDSLG